MPGSFFIIAHRRLNPKPDDVSLIAQVDDGR